MLKTTLFFIVFFCSSINLYAINFASETDTLVNILRQSNPQQRERSLTKFIRNYFENISLDSLESDKDRTNALMLKYNIENKKTFGYFIESIYQARLRHTSEAENNILAAIQLADKNSDQFLLYNFFMQLGFLQTYDGNIIGAVSSFGLAKREAITLNDSYLEVVIDINISDVFYRNGFYSESLFYLDQGLNLIKLHGLNEQRFKDVLYFNKAENYFRMGVIDSLIKYNQTLKSTKNGTYKLHTYINRTDYYLYLLQHNYKKAIVFITSLQKDKLYKFDDLDKMNLADAYYFADKPDSAKIIIEEMLADPEQVNHPEIKFHLYEVLGNIAELKHDYKLAANELKLALQQSEFNMSRLTKVGNMSARIKIDEMETSYIKKDEVYQKERLWLIFISTLAIFIVFIGAALYRNIKQKRHYEQLLFAEKKKELAFLNSHDVRKHLTNILGIIDIIKHSETKEQEYSQLEDKLLYSVEQMDKSIKNISNKLNE
jgi:hypothetical protein